jgi:hypothetical protein
MVSMGLLTKAIFTLPSSATGLGFPQMECRISVFGRHVSLPYSRGTGRAVHCQQYPGNAAAFHGSFCFCDENDIAASIANIAFTSGGADAILAEIHIQT